MSFLLSHVKAHYKLLGHEGYYSQVHVQDKQRNRLLDRRLIRGESELLDWVKRYNGKGDLYIGRNPRTKEGQVVRISCVSVDIDPVRPKDTASTMEQLQISLAAGKRLLQLSFYSKGILASSGNGCHIYWWLEKPLAVTQQFQLQQFEETIRSKLEAEFNVNVDRIYDNSRLVKIIGTQATKDSISKRRISRFILPVNWERINSTIFSRDPSDKIIQQQKSITKVLGTPGLGRSVADYNLALYLKKGGASKEDIRTVLQSRGFKAPDRDPHYTEEIIRKIFERDNGKLPLPIRESKRSIEIFSPRNFGEYEEYTKKRLERHGIAELPTGLSSLDRLTNGLKNGGIFIVGARTGVGKTSLSVTIAKNLLEQERTVLFFSTEMGKYDVVDRFLAVEAGINFFSLSSGNLKETEQRSYEKSFQRFKFKNIFIWDKAQPEIGEVAEAISRIRPDVFIFDHIQRIANSTTKRYLEISNFIIGLNDLTRMYNCAGIVNSQLNRVAEQEPPALHHLKECGALEEEAHAVILMHVPDKRRSDFVIADLAKHRSGPKGQFELNLTQSCEFKEI